jgi:hypothetical protein
MSSAEQFIRCPDSAAIARALNARGGRACPHGRTPCFLRCGTYWNARTELVDVVPLAMRLDWCARVEYLSALRDRTEAEAIAACRADAALVALVGLSRLTIAWQQSYLPVATRLRLRQRVSA